MISLVLAMVWSRRGQALTLALLALFGVAAAVASPAYLAATKRAVAAGQIAAASTAEQSLTIAGTTNQRADQGDAINGDSGVADGVSFADVGKALINLPGFTYTYAEEFPIIGLEPLPQYSDRMVFRQDECSHIRMVTGRCQTSEGEVIIGTATAQRLHLAAGDSVRLTSAKFNPDPLRPIWLPDGQPRSVVIAGTYQVRAPDEPYWGSHGYFTAVPGLGPGEPVFATSQTFNSTDHGNTSQAFDGLAGPQALDVDHLDTLRDGLTRLDRSTADLSSQIRVSTSIPDLLSRIDAGRRSAGLLVPILAVPLVLLACFSIFLAVSYGTEGRQPELAVVALRGARWWMRWWLAIGENLTAILAGALAGCVAGQLLVDAIAAARFPHVGAGAQWGSLRYAPYAALAAMLAAVLAQRRQLLSPVASLLRRNPAGAGGVRALATEAVVALLAIVAGVQLAISDGSLTGVGTLAPAFIVLALALIAARLLLPLVTRYAGRALAGGRLGIALAAFQLSRRPGAQRLFALLVATVAVAGFAASAVDVAARGRAMQSTLGVGADRVLDVAPVFRSQLLDAVRTVDPDGRYAMAVVRLPRRTGDQPIGLAVDSTRLVRVASWPAGGPTVRDVARQLRPAAADPVLFQGQDIAIDATGDGLDAGKELQIAVALSSTAGLGDAIVNLGEVHEGPFTYQQRVSICRKGCRLNGIDLSVSTSTTGVTGRLLST